MIKTIIQFVIGLSIMLFFFTLQAVANNESEELKQVRARISNVLNEIEPQHVTASPVEGWYTIKKGTIVAYISSDGRYLLQGDLIDLNRQVNLSEQSRDQARKEIISTIPEENMIIFSPEKIKYSISVFTDIDCTYCRRLHSQINEYLEQGIQIRYLLYPRNGPKSASWLKSEQVWCADDQNKALTMAKLDKDFQTQNCDASMVSTHYLMGQDVGFRGTPAIVLDNGQLVSGYVPALQLSKQLASIGQ